MGDKVLAQNARNDGRKGGKLDIQFCGPYIVTKDLGKERFALTDSTGSLLMKTYNLHRLKLLLESCKKVTYLLRKFMYREISSS